MMRVFFGRFLPPLPLIFPSIVSGVLITLCFPVVSWWWLSFVALVPVLVAVHRQRPTRHDAFRAGFLLGASCYFTMLWWIAKLIPSAGVTVPWLMTPALIILVFYLALYPAFFLLLLSAVSNWRYASTFLAAPAIWVLFELARARGELAFPWGSLGYALTDFPVLTQVASITGMLGLSFLIVLVNILVCGVFAARRASGRVLSVVGLLVVVMAWWYSGTTMIENYDEAVAADSTATTVKVAVVQPNVDLAVKWKPEFKDSTFRLIERLAKEAASKNVDMIFFPETSAPVYIDHPRYKIYRQWLDRIVRSTRTPFYIGFLDYREDGPDAEPRSYNSSGLFMPDGSVHKYDKMHLLPFGEALPLAWKYRWLRNIDFGQANWDPGPKRKPIDAGPVSFTSLICFEAVFPYLCRRGVRDGAELLVNITNDGWFSDTPGPYQHAQMAVMRSVEFRRYVLRSANTGVSFVIDPVGRLVDEVGLLEEGMVIADITPRTDLTLYARYGDWPIAILSVVFLLIALVARAPRVGYDDIDDGSQPDEPLIRVRQ